MAIKQGHDGAGGIGTSRPIPNDFAANYGPLELPPRN